MIRKQLTSKRKRQIMDSALSVAVQKGYSNSRIDDIAKTCGLSKGAVYWYYNSKKDIYLNLIDYWFHKYSSGILNTNQTKKSSWEKLNGLFEYFILQFNINPNVYKVLPEFWSLSKRDSDFNNKVQKLYSLFLSYIIEILEEGKSSGEFKDIDPKITALSILINLEGIHWFTLFNEPGVNANQYINTISNFILSDLKKDD